MTRIWLSAHKFSGRSYPASTTQYTNFWKRCHHECSVPEPQFLSNCWTLHGIFGGLPLTGRMYIYNSRVIYFVVVVCKCKLPLNLTCSH